MDTFDRYYDNDIKDITRTSTAGKDASRHHEQSFLTSLPSQKICLTMIKNKVQLINLIWVYLGEYQYILQENANALVVTGSHCWHPCCMTQVIYGQVQERQDLCTTQEEADVIIAPHLAEKGRNSIQVLADDTDVFVFLLHFYKQG